MAMVAPALIGAGGAILSSILGKSKSSTGPLDKAVAGQYKEYMPRVNEELWGMYGQEPAYQRGQFLDQAAAIRRYATDQRGQTMNMFQGQGGNFAMGNLFAGLDLDTLRALAANLMQYQQGQDQRRQGILGQIAGNVGQNVGGALSAQMQGQAMQGQQMAGLGSAAGGLMQAYMMSKLQYPQTPVGTGSYNQYGSYIPPGGSWAIGPVNAPVTTGPGIPGNTYNVELGPMF